MRVPSGVARFKIKAGKANRVIARWDGEGHGEGGHVAIPNEAHERLMYDLCPKEVNHPTM